MAGGLFGRPFVFNEKCIVFSLICMGLFLYKPDIKNNYMMGIMLFIIFVISYVAMAWYDYYFNCDIVPFRRSDRAYSLTKSLKPPAHIPEKQIKDEDTPLDISRKQLLIYMMHLIIIAPLLGYTAVYKDQVASMTYPLLGAISIFTAGYHGASALSAVHVKNEQ
jgi:hypothetical protein